MPRPLPRRVPPLAHQPLSPRKLLSPWLALALLILIPSPFRAEENYGRELPLLASFGAGPAQDVAVSESHAYVIGRGRLRIYAISNPREPVLRGELKGLGNTRQILVAQGIAYISAREDGLFLVDVKDPAAPRLISHYDSVEWATGLALSGEVLCIANRQFGVELVDVSEPASPRHLANLRTGEAQSVAIQDGWLYTGVWGSSEVVVADIRNARAPRLTARVPLDGYGDGVAVQGKYLFAATGHHSRRERPGGGPRREDEPSYGAGHGLEIFELSNPAEPRFVARLKFPKFYALGNDFWSVRVVGAYAFVADTHNGVFVVDVSDPSAPRCLGHRQLPAPSPASLPDAVGGLAPIQDHLLVAGSGTDLHLLGAERWAAPLSADFGTAPRIGDSAAPSEALSVVYRPDGQVYAAARWRDHIVLACGAAGIRLIEASPPFQELAVQSSEGIATDLVVVEDHLYVAEGLAGLSLWRLEEGSGFQLRGRYRVPGQRIRQVSVPAPEQYALVQVGGQDLHIVDLSTPERPQRVLQDRRLGLLYGHQMLDALVEGRYIAAFWHVSGLHWYDLGNPAGPVYFGQAQPERLGVLDGIATLGDQALVIREGGYVLAKPKQALAELPVWRVPNVRLSGKPRLDGPHLFLSNRATGEVRLLDVRDPHQPRLLLSLETPGNPGKILPYGDRFFIPDGYQGLLSIDLPE